MNWPAAALTGVAGLIFSLMADNPYHKITVSSSTYEVLFSFDNVYYTHCYHQIIKVYDSSNNYVETLRNYDQAVGGS